VFGFGSDRYTVASIQRPASSEICDKKKMKKCIQLTLDEEEIIELIRVLLDEDVEGALSFLRMHFKGKTRDLLEGG
jgi:hypothetical protein